MNNHYTNSILDVNDLSAFREKITNMAINAPEILSPLLLELPQTPGYIQIVKEPYRMLYDFYMIYGIDGGGRRSIPVSDEEAIERLAERSAKMHIKNDGDELDKPRLFAPYVDFDLNRTIRNLFENRAAEAITFLLSQAEPDVQRKFYNAFLNPNELARLAHVDIIVLPIESEGMMSGNRGRFLIYTSKDGNEEQLLKFTHQASCVYFLMYLIDRKQKAGVLSPIEIRENKEAFAHLYQRVYDITDDDLQKRISDLEYRKDKGGNIRTGRLKEIIYDIRKRLQERFNEYDESFFPYAMTANSHLAIAPERIHFVGTAEHLLEEHIFINLPWKE